MNGMTLTANSEPNVVWEPLAGSQDLLMSCPCNHILYEGTRGPGKTDAQLQYFRRFVGLGYGGFWRGVIFDREYKNLDDLVNKSKRWFPQFAGPKCRFLASGKDYKWVWDTGEELLFRQMKTEDDYWNYHGQEFPFIGWNELTKQPNSTLYDMAMSLNRSSFVPSIHSPLDQHGNIELIPEIPRVVLSTTNPYGVGHNWVKLRFIDVAPPGVPVRITRNVFNPRTQQREDITITQVRIFGSYKENRFLSPEYVAELEGITDPNKRKAWLEGDWDITSGGMFDDVWSSTHNIVKGFPLPRGWRIFRSFDWGSSKPFSVGWWMESDGSDYKGADGKWRSSVKGDLYRIAEWYGWNGVPNTGVRMLAKDISRGIIERELRWSIHDRVKAGPADSAIFTEENGMSIARDMLSKMTIEGHQYKGVTWTNSIKKAGSRKHGWELMRSAMVNAQPNDDHSPRENPGVFIFANCTQTIRTVPTLPRDSKDMDDVDTNAEDHIADEFRYVILSTGDRFVNGTTSGNF
ncbi:terminase-like family protein [Vibrio phage 2.117.O._10N.261.45.E9]|nr:terminase-like family protein [Vibrio phage 1.117.O._10N.261.45.E9]AUR95428.1 terminase-like family protein [Vibrio phage 1.207.B._10N.222.51.C2]AUS02319.1 terminase-like family protein [Vibrio phage 2.117.O._10N.261.45.E9]